MATGKSRTLLQSTEILSKHGAAIASAVAVCGTLAFGWASVRHFRETFSHGLFAGMTYEDRMPRDAVEFLRRNDIAGRIYNSYPWGGYLLYWLPGRQIYQDGRAHAVYSAAQWYERQQIEMARPAGLRILDQHAVDVVVDMSANELPNRLRATAGWRRLYDDGQATVWVRDSERTAPSVARLDEDRLWFPDTPGAQLFRAEAAGAGRSRKERLEAVLAVLDRYPGSAAQALLQRHRLETAVALATGDAGARRAIALYDQALARQLGRTR
jgi:hypothetical protein